MNAERSSQAERPTDERTVTVTAADVALLDHTLANLRAAGVMTGHWTAQLFALRQRMAGEAETR